MRGSGSEGTRREKDYVSVCMSEKARRSPWGVACVCTAVEDSLRSICFYTSIGQRQENIAQDGKSLLR